MKYTQKIISFLLALVMVFSLVPPMAVSAEETEPTMETVVEETAEETTSGAEETTAPTEAATEPTEATTEPTVEATVPTEAVTEPVPEETGAEKVISSDAKNGAVLASGTFGNSAWSLSEDYVLTISGSGELIFDYSQEKYERSPWYDYRKQITALVLEEGITSLRNYVDGVFNSFGTVCPNITSVTLPASLQEFDGHVLNLNNHTEYIVAEDSPWFSTRDGILYTKDGKTLVNCPVGKEGTVQVPAGVTLKESAFMSCDKLTRVTLPEGMTEIPMQAFHACTALTEISLPDSLRVIGQEGFSGCESLTAIDIPDSVSEIGHYAFGGCYKLESIVIPEGVTVLDDTFSDCSSLSQITLPSTLKELKRSVFYNCRALKEIHLPEGITKIPYMSFNNTGLRKITLPETVTDIELWTFVGSDSLERVVLGKNVQNIGSHAFYCKGLNTIVFTGNAPVIDDNAFYSATATVYYPEGDSTWDTVINQNYGGTLTWVAGEAPPEQSNIQWTFDETTGTLTISALEPGPMDDYTMSTVPWKVHRENVRSVVIEESVTAIGSMAFCNFQNLTSVSIPASVTKIGADAFYYCSALTSVTIPSGVEQIGRRAFSDCWRLAKLSLNQGLEQIGDEAFQGCKALTELTLPEGLLTIGENAFAECAGLTAVAIPASVTHIQEGAFGRCEKLQRLSVADGGVGYSAVDGILYDAAQTTLILAPTAISGSCVVPETVRHIQDKAFWGCTNLKELVFRDHITTIAPYAFYESTLSVCYPRGYAGWIGMQADYGGTVTWVPIGLLEVSGETGYVSSSNNRKGTLKFEYADEWLYEDNGKWHSELARMSLRVALSAAQEKSDDIKALYQELELDNTSAWYPKPTTETEGYIIGSRMIRPSAEEETSMLVVVTVRGGGYGPELVQNFELGYASEHSGYRYTADKLVSEVCSHIEAAGVTENIKIWITGFGRGGSVANIAAHRLNTYADKGKIPGLSREGIYAYCFGNTNVVKTSSSDYQTADRNIFNLINPNDYTAYLPFSNWGYARYGEDYYLPTSMHMFTEYGAAYAKMQQNLVTMLVNAGNTFIEFDKDTGKSKFDFGVFLPEIPLQSKAIEMIAGDLSWILLDEFAYTRDNQAQIMAAVENMTQEVNYAPVGWLLKAVLKRIPGVLTKKIVDCVGETMECFTQAHWPEVWVAWLDAIEDDKVLQMSLNTRYLSTNCPVDLSVYDSGSNLVAQFIDNVPQNIAGSTIRAYLDSDDQKIVVLPTDETFRIVTEATDSGTVSYQVQEYDIASGEITRVIDYLDIPIQAGDKLTCTAGTGTCAAYTVLDQQGVIREPDMERTGSQIEKCQLTVSAEGNGTVSSCCMAIANEFVKVQAEPAADSLFLGWYIADRQVSRDRTYRFRLEADTELTAKFVRAEDCFITVQEYIALKPGETAQLTAEVQPSVLTEFVQWSTEEDNGIVSYDNNGAVTANAVGTAYVLAEVQVEETTLTARCRIDVAETEPNEQEEPVIKLEGVQLGTTKLTTELLSTNYPTFDILLQLPQNLPVAAASTFSLRDRPVGNGVAIEEIRFTASTAAVVFDLVALDDRTVMVVPTDYALEYPEEIHKSYKSTVTVKVNGVEKTTEEELTLTVKKSEPKLKASSLTFNSFYTGQTQKIAITGGTVMDISLNEEKSNPDWLDFNEEDGTLTVNGNAGKKDSGKVYLLVETEEWNVPAEVTVSVKNAYKAPGLKLSSTKITMVENAEDSKGVELKLQPKSKKDTLAALNVSNISVAEEFAYTAEDFDPASGTFTLKAKNDFETGTITLNVHFSDTNEVVPLTVKVSVKTLSLKLPKSITLNKAAMDFGEAALTVNPGDYKISYYDIELTDKNGNDRNGELNAYYANGKLRIEANDDTEAGTYKLTFKSGNASATMTVNVIDKEPTVSLKAKGTMDLSFPGSEVAVTPSFKNYTGGTFTLKDDYTITEMKGKKVLNEDVSGSFRVEQGSSAILVTCTDDSVNTGSTYILNLELELPNGTEVPGSISLKVKRTAVKLKLSSSKLSLNKSIEDAAEVTVTCTTRGYAFTEPLYKMADSTKAEELSLGYANGKLTVAVNDKTKFGASYKIQLQAYEDAPISTLTVSILKENKSAIKSSLKAKGSIDVIRDGTEVVIIPSYKNCGNTAGRAEILQILKSDGTVIADSSWEENEVLTIQKNEQGQYIISKVPGADLDHSVKYKAKLITTFGNSAPIEATASIKVTMGKATVSLKNGSSILFAKDRNSRVTFTLTAKDAALNDVETVVSKDERFTVYSYGNGQFAIGFAEGVVDSSLIGKKSSKSVTVALNIFLEGNETEKANTTAKIKVNVLK